MSAQSNSALAEANRVRCARAQVKRDVRDGRLTVADALGLECVQGMTLWDLVQAQKGWGSSGKAGGTKGIVARRYLATLGVGEYRLVGGLTERQRRLITDPESAERAA